MALQSLLADPPSGLLVKREGQAIVIHPKGSCLVRGCGLTVLTVWTTMVAVIGGSFVFALLSTTRWFALGMGLFAVALLAFNGPFFFVLFARHTCRIDEGRLTVERRFMGWRKRWSFSREAIEHLGDEFFWSSEGQPVGYLSIYAERKRRLPFALHFEAVRWLGELISIWAEVEYDASSPWGRRGRPRQKDLGSR